MICLIPGIKSFMHKCFVKMRKRQVAFHQQLPLNVLMKDEAPWWFVETGRHQTYLWGTRTPAFLCSHPHHHCPYRFRGHEVWVLGAGEILRVLTPSPRALSLCEALQFTRGGLHLRCIKAGTGVKCHGTGCLLVALAHLSAPTHYSVYSGPEQGNKYSGLHLWMWGSVSHRSTVTQYVFVGWGKNYIQAGT